jgi:hypothetical protein
MPQTGGPVVLILAIAITAALALMVVLRSVPGKRIASVPAMQDSAWQLGMTAEEGRSYRLCVAFEVSYEGGEDDYGLAVDYRLDAGGVTVSRERAGVGAVFPPGSDRRISCLYMSSYSSMRGSSTRKAVIALAKAGPFPHPAELSATGTIHVAGNCTLQRADVFFS